MDNVDKEAIMLALLEAMEDGGTNPMDDAAGAVERGNRAKAREAGMTMRPKMRPKKMMGGGKVKGYKGGGCVMPGRGGSYGGQS